VQTLPLKTAPYTLTTTARPSADAEDGRTVEDDVRDFGEGFEVDGWYVHPSRVTVYINTSEGIFGRTVPQDAARAAEGDGNGE
jgi:hypothetical protein